MRTENYRVPTFVLADKANDVSKCVAIALDKAQM